jgi:DNA-binding MarR family transcriptional regulator
LGWGVKFLAAGKRGGQDRRTNEQDQAAISMLITLLRAYYWLDEGVRNYVMSRGAPKFTRAQGMVMANIILGYHRPSEIARELGVSRQAIHTTLQQMVRKDIVRLDVDPENRRISLVHLTEFGRKMRHDGLAGMHVIIEELNKRFGKARVAQFAAMLDSDWGPIMNFPAQDSGAKAPRSPSKPAAGRKKT